MTREVADKNLKSISGNYRTQLSKLISESLEKSHFSVAYPQSPPIPKTKVMLRIYWLNKQIKICNSRFVFQMFV